ncbi:S-layer homology domain-containing protein [Domibacillus sp. DTU_2020_1001157_1_SI_ALB_TIR_016]|uniref:S-layer homology domain-containing protein n=1 Tax=Domibacillus sp. DTU_2020_1001157_1_SI_ALB_TIR_016 TaxID=3077789 RepID=UPI0028EB3893|nr:S-layer homology domain-containing protein [Domibacillus sp. DTU_2020_1001157_1_SI_ALB_TIR_016]WNS78546.1 S-layer homology domain-containing protein [Domibacillus sp. DTU_2020_1001157_1_SI_ALB_TIR_016]
MIAKYLELDLQNAPETNFKDVLARAAQAVAALKHAGIVNGKSDVYLGAVDNITRGETAIIFMNAFEMELLEGTSENSTSTKFTDLTGRYVQPVNSLVERGIIKGKSNNRFGTTEPLTRGQFALMVYRMHLYNKKTAMVFAKS